LEINQPALFASENDACASMVYPTRDRMYNDLTDAPERTRQVHIARA
jgi:hypothetical protein